MTKHLFAREPGGEWRDLGAKPQIQNLPKDILPSLQEFLRKMYGNNLEFEVSEIPAQTEKAEGKLVPILFSACSRNYKIVDPAKA